MTMIQVFLNHLTIVMSIMVTLLNSIVLSLPHYVRLQVSQVFATIYLSYIPDKLCVESKSLKLYLFSYRNHGDFHENCIDTIGKDLIDLLQPRYLKVWGKFTPRGGLSIDPYFNYGKPGTKYEKMADYRLMNHDLYPGTIDNR